MKTITEIIQHHGGLQAVQQKYIRIENEPFMRLVVEVVNGPTPAGSWEISIAHYGEQNGDAMRDPEMTFLVTPAEHGPWHWLPLTYQNDYVGVYQVAGVYDRTGTVQRHEPRLTGELDHFARMWDRNIRQQGFLEAFLRQQSAQLNSRQRAHEQS